MRESECYTAATSDPGSWQMGLDVDRSIGEVTEVLLVFPRYRKLHSALRVHQ